MARTEFRIDGKPVNEGNTPQPAAPSNPPADPAAGQEPPTLREQVIAALQQVYDPEIPVDIYELGLIYNIDIDEQNHVRITMTLTSPACPVAQDLPGQVRAAVERIPQVQHAEVELTFDPPWSMERMSDAAKLHLGFM